MAFKTKNYVSIPSFAAQAGFGLVLLGIILRIIGHLQSRLKGPSEQVLTFTAVMSILIPSMTFLGHVFRTRQLYAFAIYLMFLLFPSQALLADVAVKTHYFVYDRLSLASNILIMLGLLLSMVPVFEFRLWKFNAVHFIPVYSTSLLFIISAMIFAAKNKMASTGSLMFLVACAAIIGVAKRSFSIVLAVMFFSLSLLLNSMTSVLSLPSDPETVSQKAAYILQFAGAACWIGWYSLQFLRKNIHDILLGDEESKASYTPLP